MNKAQVHWRDKKLTKNATGNNTKEYIIRENDKKGPE